MRLECEVCEDDIARHRIPRAKTAERRALENHRNDLSLVRFIHRYFIIIVIGCGRDERVKNAGKNLQKPNP